MNVNTIGKAKLKNRVTFRASIEGYFIFSKTSFYKVEENQKLSFPSLLGMDDSQLYQLYKSIV